VPESPSLPAAAKVRPPPLPPSEPTLPSELADDDATVVARAPMMPVGPPPLPDDGAEDVEGRIRAAVDAAVRPLRQSMVDMQRQLEEAQRILREREAAAAELAIRAVAAKPLPVLPRPPPDLDVAAIARDTSIAIDDAFDGRKRRRRMAFMLTLAILAIFGGLFAALAQSYLHH
jgi:hypothetical protein